DAAPKIKLRHYPTTTTSETLRQETPPRNRSARQSARDRCRTGSGPPLTMYTPVEMRVIATHSMADGHSPRIGMANRAVMAGHEAANAAPLDAPRMLMARPYTRYERTAVK